MKIKSLFHSDTERSVLVKKNIIGSFGLKGINVLISLFLVPLTIGYVTNQVYGIWITISSIIGWIALFDIGMGNGLRNKITENIAKGDYTITQKYISTTYFCLLLIFIPLSVMLGFICKYIDWSSLLNIPKNYSHDVISTIQLVVVFFCITIILKIQNTVLTALQLSALASLFDTIGQILVLITILAVRCMTNGSLEKLALILNICPIIVYVVSFFWIYKYKYPQLKPSISSVHLSLSRDILLLGAQFFVVQLSCLFIYGATNVLISNVSSPEYVTEYNVVYKYLSLPLMVFSILVGPLWSAYTDAYVKQDYIWMRNVYNKMFKILLCCIVGLCILILFYPLAFKLWLGNKVIIHFSMIVCVSIYVLTTIWNTLNSSIINGIGKIKIQLYIGVLGSLCTILLGYFLGHIYGAVGVVSAVNLFNFIPMLILTIQVKKILKNRASGLWNK